ncbi:YjbQ family protein [archaeon]|nr:YjbQ family protein [archaeon]
MKVINGVLELETKQKICFYDLTEKLVQAARKSGIKNGLAVAFVQHTTAALAINENEEKLMADFLRVLEKFASSKGKYRHDLKTVDSRINGHAHCKHLALNSSETIPIKDGKLLLGNWQSLFFIELDGPRPKREVVLQFIGD